MLGLRIHNAHGKREAYEEAEGTRARAEGRGKKAEGPGQRDTDRGESACKTAGPETAASGAAAGERGLAGGIPRGAVETDLCDSLRRQVPVVCALVPPAGVAADDG